MSEAEIERRFGQSQMGHYVKEGKYLTIFKFADGTRSLQGGTLEFDGRQIASADSSIDLASLERRLGYTARKIGQEKNVTWYRFDKHKFDVGIDNHGSGKGKVRVFALTGQ